jgi:hypothetical protein
MTLRSLALAGGLMMAGVLALTACDNNEALQNTVQRMSDAADQCLLDTRDRGLRYESSRNCQQLGSLSLAYIQAGGGSADTPPRYEAVYHRARATAWSALAVSRTGNPNISLW